MHPQRNGMTVCGPGLTLGCGLGLALACALAGCTVADNESVAARSDAASPLMTMRGPRSYLSGYPAKTRDNMINVVVEIPAGTNAKWEVDKRDGTIRWEVKDGQPRVVKYLGYPANYGMVPSTLLPKELGGDGDPLDVLLIGPTQPRGTVARARVIGVLKLTDRGEQDDKLIALLDDAPVPGVRTIADLDSKYPGITAILEIWMTNYKGPGKIESQGYAGPDEADRILEASMRAFATGE